MTNSEGRADRAVRVWVIGLLCYLVCGLLLMVVAPIEIPWLGAAVLLGCTIGNMFIDESDGIWLAGAVLVQATLADLSVVVTSSVPPPFLSGLRNPLVGVALVFPAAVGVFAVSRLWRRGRATKR